jgi:hypothetical protein
MHAHTRNEPVVRLGRCRQLHQRHAHLFNVGAPQQSADTVAARQVGPQGPSSPRALFARRGEECVLLVERAREDLVLAQIGGCGSRWSTRC